MSRVLVFSDPHLPFAIKDYIKFLKRIHKKYNCNQIICCGDLVDQHSISRHDKEPDAMGASDELKSTRKEIQKLAKAFPKMKLCFGNHDLRIYQVVGSKAGVPAEFMMRFEDLYQLPKEWDIQMEHQIDGVLYKHGFGYSGKLGHAAAAIDARQSCVIGHLHSFSGINYSANNNDLIFGMNVGCLIDAKAYAMRYGKAFRNKPTITCGVIIDGVPHIEYMELGSKVVHL